MKEEGRKKERSGLSASPVSVRAERRWGLLSPRRRAQFNLRHRGRTGRTRRRALEPGDAFLATSGCAVSTGRSFGCVQTASRPPCAMCSAGDDSYLAVRGCDDPTHTRTQLRGGTAWKGHSEPGHHALLTTYHSAGPYSVHARVCTLSVYALQNCRTAARKPTRVSLCLLQCIRGVPAVHPPTHGTHPV